MTTLTMQYARAAASTIVQLCEYAMDNTTDIKTLMQVDGKNTVQLIEAFQRVRCTVPLYLIRAPRMTGLFVPAVHHTIDQTRHIVDEVIHLCNDVLAALNAPPRAHYPHEPKRYPKTPNQYRPRSSPDVAPKEPMQVDTQTPQ
jgi:hypothetical protein